VVWEDKIEGERVEVTACFGGGKHYADDLSLEMRVSDVRVRLESTGNHGTEGVEYTDSSSLRIQEGDYSVTFKSELEYYPKRASDNFEWTVKGDGVSLTASGQLTTGKDSLFLDLDKLSVNALGTEMLRGTLLRPRHFRQVPRDALLHGRGRLHGPGLGHHRQRPELGHGADGRHPGALRAVLVTGERPWAG
jgi:hypothetical protein